jgi:hypothetical protein
VQSVLATLHADELDLGADQIDVGRKKLKRRERRLPKGLLCGLGSEQNMIDGRVQARLLHAEPCRRVPLGIQVDEEGGTLR